MVNKLYPPGAGDVTLMLGDETLTLKPTLAAGLAISRQAGGIRGAIDKVMALDLDTIVNIIRVGVGPKELKRLNGLEEKVFANGLMDSQGEILPKLVEYLTNIARGGRPADNKEDEEGEIPSHPTPH